MLILQPRECCELCGQECVSGRARARAWLRSLPHAFFFPRPQAKVRTQNKKTRHFENLVVVMPDKARVNPVGASSSTTVSPASNEDPRSATAAQSLAVARTVTLMFTWACCGVAFLMTAVLAIVLPITYAKRSS